MEIIYAIWISAIATGVIAISTVLNLWVISKIKSRDDEFRQQVSDLYKAIVVSNLLIPTSSIRDGIRRFNKLYKETGGTIKIFDERLA